MLQAVIESVVQERIVQTGEEFLDVTVNIIEDGETLETRRYGYPLGTTAEEVKASLAKAVANIEAERAQAVVQNVVDEANKQAKEVIDELTGVAI